MKNIFSALAIIAIGVSCNTKQPEAQKQGGSPQLVDVIVVAPQNFPNRITTNGTLLPNEEVALRSESPGRIVQLHFDEGKLVKAGQLLLQIDDAEHRANLQKLKTQVGLAQNDANRKTELFAIKGISQEVRDDALGLVATLQAEIALTESKIRNCKVIAPFAGRVGLRYVSPGAFLAAGERIATLVQENPVKVEFQVPQKYAHLVEVGQEVQFDLGAQTYQAVVYAKEPSIDINTRTLKVRARAANPKGDLLPGSFVAVTLNLEVLENALMVPSEVIVPQLRGERVFVLKGGKAVSVEVVTGLRTETHVQLVKGVAAGDTVIATALLALKDGMPTAARKNLSKAN